MNNLNIKSIAISAIISTAMTGWSCGNDRSGSISNEHSHEHHHEEGGELELSQKQIETVGIQLQQMMRREIGSSVKVNGLLAVNPQDMAEISPLIPGIVAKILVTEGAEVSAGCPVAVIENLELTNMQEDYRLALEELDLARSTKERQELLSSHGAGIRKNFEQASADYNAALLKASAMEKRLQLAGIDPANVRDGHISATATVNSPIAGIVNRIACTTGGFADMSSPIMTVTDNRKIYALVRVYEKDLPKIDLGQKVDLSLTNSGRAIEGVIGQINRTLDASTKGIDVRVNITDGNTDGLMPGMPVNGFIRSGQTETDVLPEEAVVDIVGKKYIFVLEGTEEEDGELMYHFQPVEIVTGNREQGFIEIKTMDELPEDALIVVSKAFYLASMSADHGEHNH